MGLRDPVQRIVRKCWPVVGSKNHRRAASTNITSRTSRKLDERHSRNSFRAVGFLTPPPPPAS
jgi:hypothetical protein